MLPRYALFSTRREMLLGICYLCFFSPLLSFGSLLLFGRSWTVYIYLAYTIGRFLYISAMALDAAADATDTANDNATTVAAAVDTASASTQQGPRVPSTVSAESGEAPSARASVFDDGVIAAADPPAPFTPPTPRGIFARGDDLPIRVARLEFLVRELVRQRVVIGVDEATEARAQ